ncbi:Uncharacterized protein dnm_037860 [Desulfonema magnum]|uniref:Uncharacterized protein n=1 Tax=Desulfonema magnum TaxID=45655 RepID=A0A975GNG4_9BACT|nr:Uncharacterized protein dnm_037860 [Desulfonema magnum]
MQGGILFLEKALNIIKNEVVHMSRENDIEKRGTELVSVFC